MWHKVVIGNFNPNGWSSEEGGTPVRLLEIDQTGQLVLVVGYDGTEPAQRALQSAADLLREREGRIEVVFVAHVPSTAALSAQAITVIREGLDSDARTLAVKAEETLAPADLKWHFQRREGEIAPELVAAGKEQLEGAGPTTHVVLVVGGSAHKIDRYLNSIPAKVIRHHQFEVFVVP
jgi:nucleotide-binding universal stress UspA family protein